MLSLNSFSLLYLGGKLLGNLINIWLSKLFFVISAQPVK